MSKFQQKITCHTKNQKISTWKRQSTDTITEMAEMLELSDMLQWAIMNMLEKNEKLESVSKVIEDTKMHQMGILEVKIQ